MSDLLVLLGSARRRGNSDVLAGQAMRGARAAGGTARRVRLGEIELRHCRGCLRCRPGGCQTHQDAGDELLAAMLDARALLFATPVYFWNVSGLMKTLWDRMLPLAGLDLQSKPVSMTPLLRGRRAGSIVIQEEPQGPQSSICQLFFERNFADFGLQHVGDVYAYGALRRGEVRDDTAAMAAAHDLGRRLVAD
jgi:multimeric flavodoxin WrbA